MAVLGALIASGRIFRDRLKDGDQYQFPFAEISCESPPGLAPNQFLGEVQYLGDFPDRVPLLETALPQRFQEAFQRHGWVESAKIAIGPGRRIAAQLTFRVPVLAVQFAGGVRAVDGNGILLPRGADTQGLPVLMVTSAPSAGSGRPWGDPRVEGAAKVATVIRPHQESLKLTAFEWDEGGNLALRRRPESWPVIVWGRAPGDEVEREPLAAQKLQRLLDRYAILFDSADPNKRTVLDLSRPDEEKKE
jgi:hypothetical protein